MTDGRGSARPGRLARVRQWFLQKLGYVSVTAGHDEYMKEREQRAPAIAALGRQDGS